jgi:flagellar biosynthetic protein FliR
MAGLLITAPPFSGGAVPVRVRVAIALAMTMAVAPAVWPALPVDLTLLSSLVGLVGELMLGMLLGIGVNVVFCGVQMGALMIGRQAGIALGQVYNPATESQSTILSQLYFFIALAIFLTLNGHHALIRAMIESFQAVPVMSFVAGERAADLLIESLRGAFIVAIRVAGPTLIALFLTSVSLNFIARTVPQMNILVVGFPMRVLIAFFVSALALYGTQDIICNALNDVFAVIKELLS